MPIFFILLMGLIEFALAFNATLSINTASQDGALVASEAGNESDADCLVLHEIEGDVGPPADRNAITEVQVQWTSASGTTILGADRFTRGGSISCTPLVGAAFTVPYTQVQSTYLPSQRCSAIAGCSNLTPTHPGVDTIAVQVKYQYSWHTPLGSLMTAFLHSPAQSAGYNFSKRNIFRLEPST